MKVEKMNVSDLSQDPANARKHSDRNIESIVASLRRFGQQKPIVVDQSGVVRAGNGTLRAAEILGWETIDAVRTLLKGSEATAYAIADNRTAELAEWDDDVLAAQLGGLLADDEQLLADAGFTDEELAALIADTESIVEVQEDEAPEPPGDPITKPGDLWLLGTHRLLCGDSTKADDVARLMGGAVADLCFTSPPYGAGNVAKLRDHYERGAPKRQSFYGTHKDAPGEWRELMDGWMGVCNSKCVVANVQMLADNKRDLIGWVAENLNELVDVIVWDKVNAAPQMQKHVMGNMFEFLFVFGGNGSRAVPFASWHGTVNNIFRCDPRQHQNENADNHRAVMPIALPAWVLSTLCDTAKTVYEPFAGTGTTIIACEQLGQRCSAIEIDPVYCDVIVKRWENLTGKQAVLDGNSGHKNDRKSSERKVANPA